MNNTELAHIWANQRKKSGKGSNFFFTGPSLYSYGLHYECGRIVDIEGETVALLNPDKYYPNDTGRPSPSTGKHQAYAARATNHLRQVYISPQEIHWDRITSQSALAAAVDAQVSRYARLGEQAKERRREQAREARVRKKRESQDYAEALTEWRTGGSLPYAARVKPVALRLSPDKSRIETSHGAQVPSRLAPLAWKLIQSGESDASFDWDNYKGLTLSGGTLVVGCHHIPLTEIQIIAECLGLTA